MVLMEVNGAVVTGRAARTTVRGNGVADLLLPPGALAPSGNEIELGACCATGGCWAWTVEALGLRAQPSARSASSQSSGALTGLQRAGPSPGRSVTKPGQRGSSTS